MKRSDLVIKLSAKQFSYNLPDERIAYFPLEERDRSKLLVYKDKCIADDSFGNITNYLDQDTTIIFNQSKVINARLKFYKESGASIEIFCIKPFELNDNNIHSVLNSRNYSYWECLVGGKKKWKSRSEPVYIDVLNKCKLLAYIHEEKEESVVIRFEWKGSDTFHEILLKYGNTPLPPYIRRSEEAIDKTRYQTVFGREFGSVAAPTASLHFTEEILKKISDKNIHQLYLTLHVGAGTFLPMKDEWVDRHVMHEELIECTSEFINDLIADIESEKKILAVGTTTMRTLESLYWLGVKLYKNIEIDWSGTGLKQWEAYTLEGDVDVLTALGALNKYLKITHKKSLVTQTQILIVPGYDFKIVDILQTNFHQPESTLLMLVSAFTGLETVQNIYNHAIENNYRFLSYGDCSLLFK